MDLDTAVDNEKYTKYIYTYTVKTTIPDKPRENINYTKFTYKQIKHIINIEKTKRHIHKQYT